MKRFYGSYPVLFTMMILVIIGNAGASFAGDGKGFCGGAGNGASGRIDPMTKAPSPLRDREAVPEGLADAEWGKMIRASIERDRYRLYKDERTGEYQALNYAYGLHAAFTREGVKIRPRKGEKEWIWGVRLSVYGYGSDLKRVSAAEKMIAKDNRMEYHRGDLIEWYINDNRGLEQGFTLKQRPAGRKDAAPLELHLTSMSDLVPELTKDEKAITWKSEHGETVLRYSGLVAYDATGKGLEASMKVDQGEIRLTIEDKEAVYPITIDPFIQSAKLTAFSGGASDRFGRSVSISGDTAIVGAPQAFFYLGGRKGSAYIFYRNQGETNNWGEVKRLSASDGAEDDYFGSSVSVSGDWAIVGAYGDDDLFKDMGSAYVFYRDHEGVDNWGEVQKLTAFSGGAGDLFGESVSISGDTAIVGAPQAFFYLGGRNGSAYIFYRNKGGTNNWGEVKRLSASDGAEDDYFGSSVSISGDRAIVGAPWDNDNGVHSGSAYIFYRDHEGVDNWGEVQKLTAFSGGAGDHFGASVSISGDTAIVGAPQAASFFPIGVRKGAAYIFYRNKGGTNNWGEVKRLIASDGAEDDRFGYSVSISGGWAIVGAHGDDNLFRGNDIGSAYIFYRDQGGADNWGEVKRLSASDGAKDDYFGYSVSISRGWAIVGAHGDDNRFKGNDIGSAYVFVRTVYLPGTILLLLND